MRLRTPELRTLAIVLPLAVGAGLGCGSSETVSALGPSADAAPGDAAPNEAGGSLASQPDAGEEAGALDAGAAGDGTIDANAPPGDT